MNTAIELHDSVLASVRQSGTTTEVALWPAYIHKSAGRPGWDPGSGFVQNVTLEFSNAQIKGTIGDLPAEIFSGEFALGSRIFLNMIDLPCNFNDDLSLILFLSPDNRRIVVTGKGVQARLDSEAVYVEEFRPPKT